MRNLTLGALIVFGGIVASLPFRRAPDGASPDAVELSITTVPPATLAATDDPATLDHWFTGLTLGREQAAVHSRAGVPTSLASAMRSPDAVRGIPSDAVARPRRDLRLPLTYEDLAVPLATPQYTDGRFDALASRQEVQRNTEVQQNANLNAAAMIDRPVFESMKVDDSEKPRRLAPWEIASDLPQSILQPQPTRQARPQTSGTANAAALPTVDTASPSVQGRLASDSHPRPEAEPTASAQARQRQWIRQPD